MSPNLDSAFIADWNDTPPIVSTMQPPYEQRALFVWPGLDRARLRRTKGDPWKIARLVATRTSLSLEAILVLLMGSDTATRFVQSSQVGLPRSVI